MSQMCDNSGVVKYRLWSFCRLLKFWFLISQMTLEAIKYKDGKLEILNQLALPEKSEYLSVQSVEDAWDAIHSMKVFC